MKRITLIGILSLVLLIAGTSLYAQNGVERFYQKYEKNGELLTVNLSGSLLGMILSSDDEKGKEQIKNLASLRIISTEDHKSRISRADINRLKSDIRKEQFEDLMVVRDGSTRVNFMAKEKGDYITDLVMLVDEDDNFTMVSFQGKINLSQLGKACEDLEINGEKYFEKLDDQ